MEIQQDEHSIPSPMDMSSDSFSSRRSSRNFGWSNGGRNRYSKTSTIDDDSDVATDVSVPPTPSSHHRLSATDSYYNGYMDPKRKEMDRLGAALEYLAAYDENAPKQDLEELLRQYDRVGDSNGTPSTKGKRYSDLVDPLSRPAVEAPAVDEPTVILDCHGFPAAFKTHHLHDIFRDYEHMRGGYRIKWVDDTRALIIFEHPATAKKAYIDNVSNPLAKIRPYAGPTDFLKSSGGGNFQQQGSRRSFGNDMAAKRFSQGSYGGMKPVLQKLGEC
ncbi:uncharacterized protein BYT42DRAFT_613655 [Radiomyces spectabilis]|uniref:uncharacterized protein n=1 Tax=Radiomyces spectabilis TaxID=64574 RepID=UPI002220CA0E|nr:uncharacterized protein BYT42DRAFT_613655 [Radiomyces spectabilis]KAI8379336.1 hypothetical protein BYT42DRAFT_613655 [Radiomyces spectabilis]